MNGKGRDKGIRDKGRNNGRDGKSKAQLLIENSVNRKSL